MKFLVLVLASLAACTPAMTKPFLLDDEVAALKPDTKATCIVGADIYAIGDLQSIEMQTAGGVMTTPGVPALGVLADGFAFVNVPKGAFRVTSIKYKKDTLKFDAGGNPIFEDFEYATKPGPMHIGAGGTGPMPNEMSGTCDGGFIWLGEYKGDDGGMLSKPSLKLSHASTDGEVKEALLNTKKKLAGTPWAAEVDNMKPNKPLAEDQLR